MPKKLYVGNLVKSVTVEDLTKLFEPFGPLEGVVINRDEDSGESLGYGFVELDPEKANEAKKALDGQEFKGIMLKVNNARVRRFIVDKNQRPRGKRRHSW
jgi:RNA-binding protein 23/39